MTQVHLELQPGSGDTAHVYPPGGDAARLELLVRAFDASGKRG
jgi:hypothetical protein